MGRVPEQRSPLAESTTFHCPRCQRLVWDFYNVQDGWCPACRDFVKEPRP